MKKGVLSNFAKFTGIHLCQSLFYNKVVALRLTTLLKKRLAQVFSCEFCEVAKNTFFHRTPLVAGFIYISNRFFSETSLLKPLRIPLNLMIYTIVFSFLLVQVARGQKKWDKQKIHRWLLKKKRKKTMEYYHLEFVADKVLILRM